MRNAGLALALGLAACSGESAREPDNGAASPRPPLEGRWELAEIGEQVVQRSYPLTLEIGHRRMEAGSDCVRMAWRYMNRGSDYVVQRDPVESCARGLDAVEEEFRIRLDNARSFRVRPDGVLLVDTALGGLTFRRSPAVDPDPPGPDAVGMSELGSFRGEWQVAEITGTPGAPAEPILVSVLRRELHAVSGCVRWKWRLEPDRNGQVTLWRAPTAIPPCARPLQPHESELERIAHAGHLRASGGALVLWSNNGAVTLRRPA
jgi:hypothetical protein